MDMDIYIDHIGYSLGDQKQSQEQTFEKGQLLSDPKVLREMGFDEHRYCSDSVTAYDLARLAATDSIKLMNEPATNIDGVLYATCITANGNLGDEKLVDESGDVKHMMDFPVSHLQADLGLDNAFLMGLNQTACTSLLGALRVGKALLSSESHLNRLLCLTADRFPNGAVYEQVFNLISDGAASCVLQRDSGKFRIKACHHISNGAMAQANDDETAGFYFNYTVRLMNETLALIGKELKDISWIVPQNTFDRAWKVIASVTRFDYERVLMPTRPRIGHCISGDNIINLKVADDDGCFSSGDLILMPMAGFGLNWACVILEKV